LAKIRRQGWFRACARDAIDWIARLGAAIPLGRRGEQAAERYLRRCGYRIVERNFRAAGAEIDLIAMDGDTLVFVEVKARSNDAAGAPVDAVDRRKQDRMRRAAGAFAARKRASDWPIRFDVVAISGGGKEMKLELLKDAF
jgi:putative endonuclease